MVVYRLASSVEIRYLQEAWVMNLQICVAPMAYPAFKPPVNIRALPRGALDLNVIFPFLAVPM